MGSQIIFNSFSELAGYLNRFDNFEIRSVLTPGDGGCNCDEMLVRVQATAARPQLIIHAPKAIMLPARKHDSGQNKATDDTQILPTCIHISITRLQAANIFYGTCAEYPETDVRLEFIDDSPHGQYFQVTFSSPYVLTAFGLKIYPIDK